MTMAISKAVEAGCAGRDLRLDRQHVSASAAAYAARAGLTCAVLVPTGKIALGKLAQALVHGARLLEVDGNFDDCLTSGPRPGRDTTRSTLVNSVNPVRIEGQKTAAFEICDALGAPRTSTVCRSATPETSPRTGRAIEEYRPRPASARACSASRPPARPRSWPVGSVEKPTTIATAIRIGNPASWEHALAARDESEGLIEAVSDRRDPRGVQAAGHARRCLRRAVERRERRGLAEGARRDGVFDAGERVVCTVTGHGLKDPDWAITGAAKPVKILPDVDAAASQLGL